MPRPVLSQRISVKESDLVYEQNKRISAGQATKIASTKKYGIPMDHCRLKIFRRPNDRSASRADAVGMLACFCRTRWGVPHLYASTDRIFLPKDVSLSDMNTCAACGKRSHLRTTLIMSCSTRILPGWRPAFFRSTDSFLHDSSYRS